MSQVVCGCSPGTRESGQETARTPVVRVLHVINGEHYAGAERVQDLLAQRLGRFGVEVGFACLKPGAFPQRRADRRASLYHVPMRNRFDLRPVWQLIRIVRQHEYRVLHAHTPRALLMATLAALWMGLPVVYHVHSPASRDTTYRWRNRLNALVERICLRFASAVIVVSESLKRHMLKQGLSAARVFVVHNGVPCRRTRQVTPSARTEWTVGTVALFRPRKGLEVLLEALAEVRASGFPVRLKAVGGFETPEYQRQIEARCTDLGLAGAVEWTGFTSDVDAQLAQMDLFVLPSLFGEGLPMVVLEAMAAGVPVVATRVEGIPEAIRDGHEGFLVAPGDAHGLAKAILKVVQGEVDPHGMADRARTRQRRRFSDRAMARRVAQVYRQLGV